MRPRRVILNIFACIFGYVSARICVWLLVQVLPYNWSTQVELDYIRPSIMDQADDYSGANALDRNVKILCWTFVGDKNKSEEMREKFSHIGTTWGQKCTTLLFVSEEKLNLMVDDDDKNSIKVIRGLEYLRKIIEMENYDWIMKFDANVYIIMENLRHFLLSHTKVTQPLVHATFAQNSPQNSILVLNNLAVDRLITTNDVACQTTNYPHDMDNCLLQNNISSIKFNYVSNYEDVIKNRHAFKIFKELKHCCQHVSIYFYNVKPYEMYVYEYFLYNARTVGQVPVYKEVISDDKR